MTISAYLVSSNTTLRPLYPALLVVPVKIVEVPLNLIVVLFLLHYGKHLACLIFRELDVEGEVGVAEQTDISNTKPRFGWKTANLKNGQEEFGACAPSSAPTVAWQ